jgi:hypothetical protein
MPQHAYEGLDGSGKSYLIATDIAKWIKHRERKTVWTLNINVKGAYELSNFHQAFFLHDSVIAVDELQDLFPASNRKIDPVTKHIVSMHRHNRNVILWASQAWEFVHSYFRYTTRDVWQCEALHADRMTGKSKWFGTNLQRHMAELITAPERERGIAHPKILDTRKFFINKKFAKTYDSYRKIENNFDLAMVMDFIEENGVNAYLATITNPYLQYPDVFDSAGNLLKKSK